MEAENQEEGVDFLGTLRSFDESSLCKEAKFSFLIRKGQSFTREEERLAIEDDLTEFAARHGQASYKDPENQKEEEDDNLGTTKNDNEGISEIKLEDLSFINDSDQESKNEGLEEWEQSYVVVVHSPTSFPSDDEDPIVERYNQPISRLARDWLQFKHQVDLEVLLLSNWCRLHDFPHSKFTCQLCQEAIQQVKEQVGYISKLHLRGRSKDSIEISI